jgi:hypothetical protein
MKRIFIFLIAFSFFSCGENDNAGVQTTALDKQLTGEWNNLSIHVEIQSKNNTDSNEIFAVDRPQWEERLKIKPIRTFFRADSTWNSAHYNLNDSLVYNPSGRWWLEGNRLVMMQQLPSPDTTSYSLVIQNDTASFECVLDWDMDGKKDDRYSGKQQKKF